MRWKATAALVIALAGSAAIARSVAAASQRPAACTSWATRVDGVVVDREGKGVAGAFVIAHHVGAPDPLRTGVVTDREGHFRIVGLAPGEYAFVSLARGAIATTPAMPVVDRLIVSLSLGGEATRI